jgi:DNA-binding Lrp family transcriptional regulator/GTPase SAR1 family protein
VTLLDSLKVQCYGRGEEIKRLNDFVQGRRPAILVYGDSGIGKTTLLRSFCETLPSLDPDNSDTLVGFYGVGGGENDPLLWSLDALLKTIYTLENWRSQPPIAWSNLKAAFSQTEIGGFRKFLTRVSAAPHSSLAILGDSVLSIIGKLGDSVASLDAKVETMLRPQDTAEFNRLINLLNVALPQKTLVLVIDNLNAASETAIASIENYLSQRPNEEANVHLVMSWKRESANSDRLQALEYRIREYGGEFFQLQQIRQKDVLEDWLRTDLPWFGKLSSDQRKNVVALTGGLPEVIARWRKHFPNQFDEEALSESAHEVVEGKYSELVKVIAHSDVMDQKILYALALLGRPVSIQVIAAHLGLSYSECRKRLQAWSRDNFVLQSSVLIDETGKIHLYSYDHDNKKAIALSHLPDELGDTSRLAKDLYSFLLRNWNSPSPGFSNLLSAPLSICEHANVARQSEIEELKTLTTMIESGVSPSNRPWIGPQYLRGNVLIHYLGYSLHCRYGERTEILDWISRRPRDIPSQQSEALAWLFGLAHLTQHLKDSDAEKTVYKELLTEIRQCNSRYDRSESFDRVLCAALGKYPYVMAELDESISTEFAELANKYPNNPKINSNWCQFLAAEIILTSKKLPADASLDRVEKIKDALRKFPEAMNIAQYLGASISMIVAAGSRFPHQTRLSLIDNARSLRLRFPASVWVAQSLGRALANSFGLFVWEVNGIKRTLSEIRQLCSDFPSDKEFDKIFYRAVLRAWMGLVELRPSASEYIEQLRSEKTEILKRYPEFQQEVST